MAVMKTHISWTDSTWNPTTGCTKVSAGCLHCYAEYIVEKRWGQDFATVISHDNRLAAVSKFKPLAGADGKLVPRRVFVNSMSDLMHEQIAESFRDQCFEAMEGKPDTVFQVLTKRPMTMSRYVEHRYRGRTVPDHIWFGASVEDNRVRSRIDTLRAMKQAVGGCILFLSIEPLLGDPDKHDYREIDQVLIGGESGVGARDCLEQWCHTSVDLARMAGSAVWFKQWGQWKNNPLYQHAKGPTHLDKVRQAIRAGEKQARIGLSDAGRPVITGEKGGATLGGKVLNEMPPVYALLTKRLRGLFV
jgi:protein gp37